MNPISTIDDFLARNSTELANTILDPCPVCGRKHPVPFGAIQIGRGVVNNIPHLAKSILGGSPRRTVVIYDQAIEAIIQAAVIQPLQSLGFPVEPFAMAGEPGHLLDSGVMNGNQTASEIGSSVDLLISAGSGVIGDLTKWIATCLDKPFIICGTAPSMNGYTSITATMTEKDIKLSK